MSGNSDIKQHISIEERAKWNKVISDFKSHLGSGGTNNHRLGDGSTPGFSTNDYTKSEKIKLAGIQNGALNNPHPSTHPASMITGLATVSTTGNYKDLLGRPTSMAANGGNSDTVGGIRITISPNEPSSPKNLKEIWLNTNNWVMYSYYNAWIPVRGVYQ